MHVHRSDHGACAVIVRAGSGRRILLDLDEASTAELMAQLADSMAEGAGQ